MISEKIMVIVKEVFEYSQDNINKPIDDCINSAIKFISNKMSDKTKSILSKMMKVLMILLAAPIVGMVLYHMIKMAPHFAYYISAYISFYVLYKISEYVFSQFTLIFNK